METLPFLASRWYCILSLPLPPCAFASSPDGFLLCIISFSLIFFFFLRWRLTFDKTFFFWKLMTLLVRTGVFWCFHNPPNSDMDYRIFNMQMWSFCLRIHTEYLGLLSLLKDFGESAQNFTLEKSQDGCKAEHVTATHPFGDHARSCLALAFESEYSFCSLPLTLHDI